MKKFFLQTIAAVAALMAIFILSACGAKDETPALADAAATAAPEGTAAPDAEATPAAYGANASARVTATAAYSYADGDKTRLYAAVEYQNDGDCPIAVSNVKLTITAAGASETAEFVPELSDYIVLLPGETGYIARWLGETTIPAGETITLNASLTAQKRDERGARITVDNLYIADTRRRIRRLRILLTCQEGVDRNKVVKYVEEKGVQTRMLFAGNLIKHPCFDEMRKENCGYRVAGTLENTDRIMRDTFWVGVYPGMTDEMIDYMAKTLREACRQ